MFKKVFIGIGILLVIIQFIPVDFPENSTDLSNDLIATHDIPDDVAKILKTSCYDCHSSQSVYPWYSYVAPTKFLVTKDINEAREHLNFSNWNTYSKMDQMEALDDFAEEIEEGEMPMKIYTVIHSEATLTDAQKETLLTWSENFAESLFE